MSIKRNEVIYILFLGENLEGKIKLGIKLLFATNKENELTTTSKGALLSLPQFQRFLEQIEEVSKGVKDMNSYVIKEVDEEDMELN